MYCGVRSALGPGRLSLSLENSLQGGALHATPTSPEKQSLVSSRVTLSSRISCVLRSAKSKGAKKSPPMACSALDSGHFFPCEDVQEKSGLVRSAWYRRLGELWRRCPCVVLRGGVP